MERKGWREYVGWRKVRKKERNGGRVERIESNGKGGSSRGRVNGGSGWRMKWGDDREEI